MGLTFEQVKITPEYKRSTRKQKLFIEKMAENGGDAGKATFDSFPCKDQHTADCLSYKVMNYPHVYACIQMLFADTREKAFTDTILRRILQGKVTEEELEAWRFYAKRVKLTQGDLPTKRDATQLVDPTLPAVPATPPPAPGESFLDDFED